MLKTNRGLLKTLLLGLITLGIYPLVEITCISSEINFVAGRHDGKKTMNFLLMTFIFTPLTLGIAQLVWYHRISKRIGDELERRCIPYSFGAADYWLWNILGAVILVGPFVYIHKLLKAMNKLNKSCNAAP